MASTWTKVNKPTESSVFGSTGGMPMGLLLALTYAENSSSVVTGWTDVTKPTSSTWTAVAKPTSSVWSKVTKPTT